MTLVSLYPPVTTISVPLRLVAVGLGSNGYALKLVAENDPPDEQYKQIARPVIIHRAIRLSGQYAPATSAMSALFSNLMQSLALARALTTIVESRAFGRCGRRAYVGAAADVICRSLQRRARQLTHGLWIDRSSRCESAERRWTRQPRSVFSETGKVPLGRKFQRSRSSADGTGRHADRGRVDSPLHVLGPRRHDRARSRRVGRARAPEPEGAGRLRATCLRDDTDCRCQSSRVQQLHVPGLPFGPVESNRPSATAPHLGASHWTQKLQCLRAGSKHRRRSASVGRLGGRRCFWHVAPVSSGSTAGLSVEVLDESAWCKDLELDEWSVDREEVLIAGDDGHGSRLDRERDDVVVV